MATNFNLVGELAALTADGRCPRKLTRPACACGGLSASNPGMVIWLPLLIALIGVLMYALCTNAKLIEIGRILFWTGTLAFLLTFPGHAVSLLH
jgi:hypothetical protein